MPERLRIAASQFPVSGDLARNSHYILGHIRLAAKRGAQVVLFPETALSGYAPRHLKSLAGYDWSRLEREIERVAAAAAAHGLWVMLGTMRRNVNGAIHSSIYAISKSGSCEAVYDKRSLYGREAAHYAPGDKPCVVDVRGVKCGLLICYDNCFPEFYAGYRAQGVEVVFHSFYNAANSGVTSIKDLMWANLIVRAADHRFWIAASNSSEAYSPLPASIVRPDGSAVRARRNRTALIMDDYLSDALGWTYDNRRSN